MRRPDKTRLFTLYSYKGGVGRTMAVANVACQMAIKHGKSVICVDWDLEAPGLHHYFDFTEQELANRPGLLDYLMDFVVQVGRGAEGKAPELKNYLVELKPHQREKIVFGSVRLLHCGRTDAGYMSRVQHFDWNRFYREQHGYEIIETLKKQLRQEADMTLIDARAGQADVGLVPTVQVPDAIVLLFASNRQSLHGVEQMARSFHKHPQRLAQALPEPRILLVPARVFHEEDRYTKWIEESATPVFNRLVADGVVSKEDQPKGLWQCYLTVDPKYSIDETLVVLDQSPVVSRLKQSYVELAQAMNNLFHGREIWSTVGQLLRVPTAQVEGLFRAALQAAVERGDRDQVAFSQYVLSTYASLDRRLDEAESLIQASIAYHTEVDNRRLLGHGLLVLGLIRRLQGRHEESWVFLERALDLGKAIGDTQVEAMALQHMAFHVRRKGLSDEAYRFLEQLSRLPEQDGPISLRSIALREMGDICANREDRDGARSLYEQSLEAARQANDAGNESETLLRMAIVRRAEGRLPEAWSLFEEARARAEESGNTGVVARAMLGIADHSMQSGDLERARAILTRALEVAKAGRHDDLVPKVQERLDGLGVDTPL
jgi:tetratricopeptide (TPR) repeat protein/Mrp family chromosome partitioning ATPase